MAFYLGDTLIRLEILSHCHTSQVVWRHLSRGVIAKENSFRGIVFIDISFCSLVVSICMCFFIYLVLKNYELLK